MKATVKHSFHHLIFLLACGLISALIVLVAGGAAPEKAGGKEGGQASGDGLALKAGDHIAIIGNTLGDRMQHFGNLETLIYARHPKDDLVIRNLAVAGDEVALRRRSENFGTPDEWLTKTNADVIFAFFGFNESFKGEDGLPQFKKDLDQFLKDTLAKNYSGKGHPRVVLFSPIANEKRPDPNYPDPAVNNKNIALYTAAMADVAKANDVAFVDLYGPSQRLYAEAAASGKPLTINGLHLNETGDRLLAGEIFRALFGETAPEGDHPNLRNAILAKNQEWHSRYRTVDGYNVYGGRSQLAFPSTQPSKKIRNYDVMQEEMAQRDVITANLDKKVWAAARDGEQTVVDAKLPLVTPVPTNLPGGNPDKSHKFLGGEEAIKLMEVHPGCKVNLFASEEQFPELINPVQMAWDTKGRLWVAVWRNYPERTPTSTVGDSLLIFEDTNGDGKADKVTHFLDDLNCPTGFQFYEDGVLVMQAPDLWFVRDTDGDGKADWKERVVMGMDSADSHHTTNSMCYDPGGATYLSDGVFHRTQVETAVGPVRNNDAAIYRFEPHTGRFERYIAYGFANPHGRVFDYWGNDLVTDATGNNTYFGPAFSGFIDYPAKHKTLKQFWDRPSRPCPGTGIISSRHFPDDWQGNFLNINVIGFQGVYRVKVKEDGSGLGGETLPNLISSTDRNFRPICISNGPDGAIYFCDWSNAIIGHMQHHIRDPNRDHLHGRIYRITYEGRSLLKAPKIDGAPIPALLDLLKAPENGTRELAKIELDKHPTAEVMAALAKWTEGLDKKDPAYEHHMAEALWLHQWQNVVDVDLLKRMLRSPEPRARAAATRVLCYWRDRVPEALALLKTQAGDEDPRVRLQAVRAASFFDSPAAVDAALAAVNRPTDYYLDYTLGETLRQLEPIWRKALADGTPIAADNVAGMRHLLGSASLNDLAKLPKTPALMEILLTRSDTTDSDRIGALQFLADAKKAGRATVLLDLIDAVRGDDAGAASRLARLLPMQPTAELKPVRQRLEALAATNGPPALKSPAWGALAMADGSFDATWQEAMKSPANLVELLYGIPLIYDPDIRALAYDKVMPLVVDKQGKAPRPEVRRAAVAALVSMNHEPQAVAAALVGLIEKGEDVTAAARGLRALPMAKWAPKMGDEVSAALVAWAKKLPADKRGDQETLEAVQLAGDLVGASKSPNADALRKDLKGLRVAVFVVTTVREQMRYDTTRLVVEAGKPFEIIFENGDFMPHNLVVVNPGKREAIGTASMNMRPDQLDKQGRAFIPSSKDIIAATKLIEPSQKVKLKVMAPTREGDYEYVCTFPGHWEQMWGRLIVTKDVDAYLRDHPDAAPPRGGDSSVGGAGHEHKH